MAHVVVAGGAGYIGSHALRALRRAGHTAVVLDDLRAGRPDFVGRVPLVEADTGDRAAVRAVFERHGPIDGVMHFAASLSVPESVTDPLAYYGNNVMASWVLIEEALRHGVRAFVLSSTAAVYGHPRQQPIPESAPLEPCNPYGATKMMVERILADVEHAHGLRWMALRYFNACGADPEGGLGECHEPETRLIPVALEAATGLRPRLALFGTDYATRDGTCVRDYVHVSDLAEAHRLALEALLSRHASGAYNLGTGIGRTNLEILEAVGRVTGRPVPRVDRPRRPGDPAELVADASRFRQEMGWQARHSDLDTIVRTAWQWLRRWKGC